MKRLGVLLLSLDGNASPSQVTSLQFDPQFSDTHLYSMMKKGTFRVRRLAQEHDTVSPAIWLKFVQYLLTMCTREALWLHVAHAPPHFPLITDQNE